MHINPKTLASLSDMQERINRLYPPAMRESLQKLAPFIEAQAKLAKSLPPEHLAALAPLAEQAAIAFAALPKESQEAIVTSAASIEFPDEPLQTEEELTNWQDEQIAKMSEKQVNAWKEAGQALSKIMPLDRWATLTGSSVIAYQVKFGSQASLIITIAFFLICFALVHQSEKVKEQKDTDKDKD